MNFSTPFILVQSRALTIAAKGSVRSQSAGSCHWWAGLLGLLVSLTGLPGSVVAAPVVWSGYDFTFTKTDVANPELPANQDKILDNVIITRGATQGIFNIAQESSYADPSPLDTEWAFPANNPGKQISAANWEDLSFAAWRVAADNNPPATVGANAVMHIISADIYLDIRFLAWGRREGNFSYIRALPDPVVSFACGDIDQDKDVDSSDLLAFIGNWTGDAPGSRRTFADGDCDSDGDIDSSDMLEFLANWTGDLSNPAAAPDGLGSVVLSESTGNGTQASALAVPEPTSTLLCGIAGLLGLLSGRGRRKR